MGHRVVHSGSAIKYLLRHSSQLQSCIEVGSWSEPRTRSAWVTVIVFRGKAALF